MPSSPAYFNRALKTNEKKSTLAPRTGRRRDCRHYYRLRAWMQRHVPFLLFFCSLYFGEKNILKKKKRAKRRIEEKNRGLAFPPSFRLVCTIVASRGNILLFLLLEKKVRLYVS